MKQKELSQNIESYRQDIITELQQLIKIKSITGKQEGNDKNYPYHPEVKRALHYVLELGKELNLRTGNVDDYAGWVEIGSGSEIVGILCHLDVVPAGEEWNFAPFGGEIEKNRIYGRGSVDNKGPAIALIYVLKALQELDLNLNKRLRLIFGTNEESGWGGIDYYLQHEPAPDIAFSPDGRFPVIHAEKGILIFDLKKEFSISPTEKKSDNEFEILEIQGGEAPNMVPDFCQACLKTSNLKLLERKIKQSEFDLSWEAKENQVIIKSRGKSAHGSTPEQGKNAISQLLVFITELLDLNGEKSNDLKQFIKFYNQKIGLDYYGQNINCEIDDDISGKLIFNTGKIKLNREKVRLTVNIRYPVTYSHSEIVDRLKKSINEYGLNYDEDLHLEPLHIDRDDKLVKTLNRVYNQIRDTDKKPIAIGGGTYARSVEKAVAFGPVFPEQEEMAHKKDEYIEIDKLMEAAQVYGHVLLKLGKK